jgi:hypothetical protein
MHYHLIVHKEHVINQITDPGVSLEAQNFAKKALETIEQILASDSPNVLEIPNGIDPRNIPDCITQGDSVTLYGGNGNACLSGTLISLILRNVTAKYHPNGYC